MRNLQRGDQAIARRAVIAQDHMPALFAAEAEAVFSISSITFWSPTAVRTIFPPADLMAASSPALLITVATKVSGQGFSHEHLERGDGHDVVAVNQIASFVAQQDAVGVAVVRDARCALMLDDLGTAFPGASSRNPC